MFTSGLLMCDTAQQETKLTCPPDIFLCSIFRYCYLLQNDDCRVLFQITNHYQSTSMK